MKLGRAPAAGVVAGLLLLGAVVDRTSPDAEPPAGPAQEASAMPTAAPASALSSTFYCVGATAPAGGNSGASVVVANPRNQEARGSVTIVSTAAPPRVVPLVVGPSAVSEVSLGQVGPGVATAAVVDLQAGQAAAELSVSSSQGDGDVTPCASSGSGEWHFADGSTARDANLLLSLFNPFPEDAIADLSFSTDQGRAAPGDLQGVVVPARGLVLLNVGEHVRRRDSVATTVAVRTGRLVATQSMARNTPGRTGTSVTLGAPSLAPLWFFPDGLAANGVVERYSVYNPGPQEAEVSLEVNLDEGVAEPFEIRVPAGDRVTVTLNDEARVPKGVGHSTTVRSGNDVPVAAMRTLEVAVASRSGRSDALGARRSSERWLFPAGGTSQNLDEVIVVQNTGEQPASVSLAGLVGGEAMAFAQFQGVTVQPGRRQAFRIGEAARRVPMAVVVNATAEVVAERAVFVTGRVSGLSSTVGIPLE